VKREQNLTWYENYGIEKIYGYRLYAISANQLEFFSWMQFRQTEPQVKLRLFPLCIIWLIAVMLTFTGCASNTQVSPQQTTGVPTSSVSPKTSEPLVNKPQSEKNLTPAIKASPSPTPLPKPPNLNVISLTLALATAQEYTEYPVPIYLRRNERLHLYWTITTGGDHLSLAFTTPDAEFVSIKNDGAFARNASTTYPDEKLFYKGNVVFSPPEYGWNEGYYVFQPHIRRGDAAVGGKLYYWIESSQN
jgi:hypothetical protein